MANIIANLLLDYKNGSFGRKKKLSKTSFRQSIALQKYQLRWIEKLTCFCIAFKVKKQHSLLIAVNFKGSRLLFPILFVVKRVHCTFSSESRIL